MSCLERNIKDIQELSSDFYKGCKSSQNIGLEFEKIPVNQSNYKAVEYIKIKHILSKMKDYGWSENILEGEFLGLTGVNGNITLEPGSQFELSLRPVKNIQDIDFYISNYNKNSSLLAQGSNIKWLGYGIQPLTTFNNITIIPKKRYEMMTEYFKGKEELPYVMMRETAGIQVNMDYSSEEDAIEKLSISLRLSPIISAMYSNSPIRNGKLTGYKSFRAHAWLHTDCQRCGLISDELLGSNTIFSFDKYTQTLLDVNLIFIKREDKYIKCENLTFREFLKNGYNGYNATIEDWKKHLSLYFSDVRLKQYIEIRNHDSQKEKMITSIPALWKGILYNKDCKNEVKEILNKFSKFDYLNLRQTAPKLALEANIGKYKVYDLAKEIINLSYVSLKSFKNSEDKFLEPIIDLVYQKITPADIIIKNWETSWNKDLSKLIEYTSL